MTCTASGMACARVFLPDLLSHANNVHLSVTPCLPFSHPNRTRPCNEHLTKPDAPHRHPLFFLYNLGATPSHGLFSKFPLGFLMSLPILLVFAEE